MRWLIRTVTRTRKGSVSRSDDSYVGEQLTIGRGAGQGLFLPDLEVALEHARVIPVKGNRFRVESLVSAGVRVDGKLQSAGVAGIGSRIEIADHVVSFIKPPEGFDAALEVSTAETDSESTGPRRRVRTALGETWLGKRGPAWLLLLAMLVIGLVLPVLGSLSPPLNDTLRATPGLPSDGLWDSGPLQAAHHYFGERCESCHTGPFQQVQDEACVACHAGTLAHADPALFELPELTGTDCGWCHRDHNGVDGLIVDRQVLCTDCHGDLQDATQGRTILADVHDFGDAHPQFKVELASWDAEGNFRPRRVPLGAATLSEESNLKFPHDVHLDPAGLAAPDGDRVLGCGDCHRPEPGGGKMQPVAFEAMCHDCHRLGFDPTAPTREVPHGDAAQVLFMLEDYYAGKALRGAVTESTAPPVVRKRRRPGESVTRQERLEITAWADERAERTAQSLFEGQACGVCHEVSRVTEGERVLWQVAPVRVAGVWFAQARFTHESHTTMDCASCHAAQVSASSDDVLIPGIDTASFGGEVVTGCRECHAGEASAKGKVASPCIDCHRYHGYVDIELAEN